MASPIAKASSAPKGVTGPVSLLPFAQFDCYKWLVEIDASRWRNAKAIRSGIDFAAELMQEPLQVAQT